MGAKKRQTEDPFSDVHLIARFIEKRLTQLQSDGPIGEGIVLARPERDAILAFVKARRPEVSEVRVRTYLSWLPKTAALLGSGFLAPDRETPASFVEVFPPRDFARGTRATGANCLGTFWRWWLSRQGREFPSWLHIRLEKWKPTNGPSDMLSRDDVAQIAEHALNFRDRAWIWTLFNSGCRPGEIYQLRIGDVVPHDEGYVELRVRREKNSAPEPAPVYEDAVPALLAWLAAHPRRDVPEAPLWVDLSGGRAGKVATYRAMYKALESAAARAKTTKPVTAYALRRSRLTMLAKDPAISTSVLEKVAGWVPGSNVARHYIHLGGKDVINALNARYGVKVPSPGEPTQTPRTPSKCGRCKTVNPPGAVFCMTCGGPLSLPAVKQIEEARAAEGRLAELLRQPEAVEFLAQLLAKRSKGKDPSSRRAEEGDAPREGTDNSPVSDGHGVRPGRRSPLQRVVSLADAEDLIRSGYEFVAPLGADRAILRAPLDLPGGSNRQAL
jgi:integrase/recombinase XerD